MNNPAEISWNQSPTLQKETLKQLLLLILTETHLLHHTVSQKAAGNALNAKTTISKAEKNASDARKPKMQRTTTASHSICSYRRPKKQQLKLQKVKGTRSLKWPKINLKLRPQALLQ